MVVVGACLRSGAQEISLSGERFTITRTVAPKGGSLRELYGALAPIAVAPAAGGDVAVCPGRDLQIAAGDEVTLIATPKELRAAGLNGHASRPGRQAPGRPRGAPGTSGTWRCPCCTLPTGGSCWP